MLTFCLFWDRLSLSLAHPGTCCVAQVKLVPIVIPMPWGSECWDYRDELPCLAQYLRLYEHTMIQCVYTGVQYACAYAEPINQHPMSSSFSTFLFWFFLNLFFCVWIFDHFGFHVCICIRLDYLELRLSVKMELWTELWVTDVSHCVGAGSSVRATGDLYCWTPSYISAPPRFLK